MKQIRTISIGLIAFVLVAMTTSCEKQYITKEYYSEYGSKVYTREYTIKGDEWKVGTYDNGRKYLYAECGNKEITENVMKTGAVLAYLWFTYNIEDNASSWNMLPYVYPYQAQNSEGELVTVGENVRFEYETGKVIFIVEDLDGLEPEPMTDELLIKVVVLENRL